MSEVHLAENGQTGERVAVKHVPAGGDPSHRSRLRREARTTSRLQHPSIVRARDVIDGENGLWLIMDYVDGTTVYDLVQSGPMEVPRSLSIALQIAEGLAAAHDLGILHRDLKSENVMLETNDRVRLLDFGLAKALWREDESQTLTVHGEVMGTCRAMSPEQARGLRLDGRSDLFALGSLLYEMVTGSSPFQATTPVATMTRVCSHQPPPASSVESGIPRSVSHLISRLMAKKPADRPADARQAAEEIRDLLGQLGPGSRLPETRTLVVTGAFGVALLVGLTWWGAGRFGDMESAVSPPDSIVQEDVRRLADEARDLLRAGRLEEARRLAYSAVTFAEPPPPSATSACRLLAQADLRAGFPDAARRWLELALLIADHHGLEELESTLKAEISRIDRHPGKSPPSPEPLPDEP